ncbi:diacylglyceryl transferase [Leptobacterium flavescens]|uniref:Diacylglyceryl transferase n=1 Tax=Leptobacterium flavescens TaxID=472055 RepID=A0A6P0UJN4_9FLAO|nr:DUF6787 family protein [Leptobacterium flavescens]NER12610.1 diacylglyceryl transferase [Leptobacterium flavescens]
MKKLKQRWDIESNFQLIVILLVFAINGSLSVMLVKPIINFIGISESTTSAFIFWPVRILLMFIVYQVLLIIVGTLFGQHKFFWKMEKKMLMRIGFRKVLEKA